MFAGPLGRSTFTPPKSSFDSPLYGLVSLRRSQLNGKEDDIWRFLELGVSKTAIAKLTGGHVASQSGKAEYPKIASP